MNSPTCWISRCRCRCRCRCRYALVFKKNVLGACLRLASYYLICLLFLVCHRRRNIISRIVQRVLVHQMIQYHYRLAWHDILRLRQVKRINKMCILYDADGVMVRGGSSFGIDAGTSDGEVVIVGTTPCRAETEGVAEITSNAENSSKRSCLE